MHVLEPQKRLPVTRFVQIDEQLSCPNDPTFDWRACASDLMDELCRLQSVVMAAGEFMRLARHVCPECAEGGYPTPECRCDTFDLSAEEALEDLEFALTQAGEL